MIWVSVSMILVTFALGMVESHYDSSRTYDIYFVSLIITVVSWLITAVIYLFKK